MEEIISNSVTATKFKPVRGRPTDYNDEVAAEICEAIATSSTGLKKLRAQNPHWPVVSTIYIWRTKNKHLAEQYAQAKCLQVEVLVDEILEIADDSSNDFIVNDEGKL